MRRTVVAGLVVAATVSACVSSQQSQSEEPGGSETGTTVVVSASSSSSSSTTTAASSPPTTVTQYVYPDRCLRPDEPHRLSIFYGPVDGQYYAMPDTLWTNGSVCPEAIVTVSGFPAEVRVGERTGEMPYWNIELTVAEDCTAARPCIAAGSEPIRMVYQADFADGTSITQTRQFTIDRTLQTFSGWIIEIDDDPPSVTFGAATYEPGDDDGTIVGPITSIETYPVLDDAAFILLQPDNMPPKRVLTFDDFYLLMTTIETGCPPGSDQAQLMSTPPSTDYDGYYQCFFATSRGIEMTAPTDTPGYPFTISITPDGEVRQLEQQFSP